MRQCYQIPYVKLHYRQCLGIRMKEQLTFALYVTLLTSVETNQVKRLCLEL
jgi:hypothetical protein